MRILHVITDLHTGGAEIMLCNLLSATKRKRFDPVVISLISRGTLGLRIEALGVPIFALGMTSGWLLPHAVWCLAKLVRLVQPDIIHGWMYHGNLAASLAGAVSRNGAKVLWSIHNSLHDLTKEKRMTSALIHLGATLSVFPDRIIYVSGVSLKQHEELGYSPRRSFVLPNGFDCERFKPSTSARFRIRRSLRLADDAFLIGSVGRYHPMKDHDNFLEAAGRLAVRRPNVHFVMVGQGVDQTNYDLMKTIRNLKLDGRVHLLGLRANMPEIFAGFDIFSSSSLGEAFPVVIGEAMACGVPCVVTNVGDSARIVGDTGKVVPPKDPDALADAMLKLMELPAEERRRLGQKARERIGGHYSLDRIVGDYEKLYLDIATH